MSLQTRITELAQAIGADIKQLSQNTATQAELDAHTGASTGAHAASAISNTPAGNISATTVQAAINELDSEKQAVLVSGTNIKTVNNTSLLGSGNVAVEPTIAAGTTSQYWRGDKTWRDFFADVRAATLTGLSTAVNAVVTAADTVLSAIGKLQAQITGLASSKLDVAATSFGGNSATATKLATARTIGLSGDASGSTSFDGSADVTISVALVNSGVTAGTYPKVTVDAKGRVTAGTSLAASDIPALDWSKITTGKPTTLSGYGITDAVPSSHVGSGGSAHAVATTSTSGFMSASDKAKLDGVAANANNYSHPTGDGNLHVPATGTTNNGKVLKAGSTAGSLSWAFVDWNEVTNKPSTYAPAAHTHAIADVSGLQTALDGKAALSHTHGDADLTAISWSKVTGKPTTLSGYGITDAVLSSDVVTTATANKILKLDANSKLPASITGNADGNAATATKLQTARTINGVSFDGSANITIADGTKLPLAGGTLTGKLTTAASATGGAGLNLPHGAAPTTPSNGDVWTTTSGVFAQVNGATKTVAFTDSSITGNAATATKLQTARTLTIGNTSKSFDGSANVSWSLAEIGTASETASGVVELATAAEAQAGTDATRAVTPNGLAAYAGALSFRNKLINAAFTVNQRGYANGAATTAANQYTLDRWRVVTSGQALSWSGTAPNITITAPAGGVEQVIEGIWIEGGTYTLSWTGTATATVNGSAVANGGEVTLTAGANATVRFSGGTVSKPQLERGSYATQFEHRPHGLEMMLCQRYYEPLSVYQRGYAGAGPETLGMAYNFRVTKRAPPTITLNLIYANASGGQVFDVTTNGFSLRANVTSTGDAIYNGAATAVAEL